MVVAASAVDQEAPVASQPLSERVVAEALSWLGTPYHHAADIKGVGVDCAMLLVRVFVDTGIVEPFDPRPYPPDWYLHHDEERFLGWIAKFGRRLHEGEAQELGDVRLYTVGRCVSHGGIVIGEGMMAHADRAAGKVVRCESARWGDRYFASYRVQA